MSARTAPPGAVGPDPDETIAGIESALHSLARWLKQARLHDFMLKRAGVDIDQAGLALLYVLRDQNPDPRLTDLADRLRIDAPAVTRKAQQLERLGLVSRVRDAEDARASRLRLTAQGCQVIDQFLVARRCWLTQILSTWPGADRSEFARLLRQFTADIHDHLGELDECPLPSLPREPTLPPTR
ncbi:MAG TPA: MarR family winged helix-turn-helix transcriptional regulator [Streptosporangiaceae bacterium]|jgi:DNA-binding MarR family transcriptional regulator|nr:MarR family winged helix-turn-helix transcriptional regulator [Streptosporangiaceae bacterium]